MMVAQLLLVVCVCVGRGKGEGVFLVGEVYCTLLNGQNINFDDFGD